jgi:hypothetical protein
MNVKKSVRFAAVIDFSLSKSAHLTIFSSHPGPTVENPAGPAAI